MARLTLYVKDVLFDRIQENRDRLQLSQIFADAVEEEIMRLEHEGRPVQLDRGEKEFMEICRHFKIAANENIGENNIQAVQNRFMSPPAIRKQDEILQSLEAKAFIKTGTDQFDMLSVVLLEAGEQYLYGKY